MKAIYFISLLFATTATIVETVPLNETKTEAKFERVVTDFIDVYNGVPLDYRYNESSTATGGDGLVSAPGCPKSEEGYPWVYYGDPSNITCYLAGEGGPCEYGQVLFTEEGSHFGFCNCECLKGMKSGEIGNKITFCGEGSEYVYIPKEKKCYGLNQKGPCKEDEWLIKTVIIDNNNSTEFTVKCKLKEQPVYEWATWLPVTDSATEQLQEATTLSGDIIYDYYNSNSDNIGHTTEAYFASVAFVVTPSDCEEKNMKYSKLLQKCIEKFNFIF